MLINVEIKGVTPLLMNKFVDENASGVKIRDKNISPRDEATKCAYINEQEQLYLPCANIYACIVNAGRFHKDGKVKLTTARSSLIPAGIMINGEITFFKKPTNFEVDSRAVVVPATGGRIMKHRARLDEWEISFQLEVDKTMFNEKMVRQLVDDAGKKVGLGDFRPERKGIYGRFVVIKWEVVN